MMATEEAERTDDLPVAVDQIEDLSKQGCLWIRSESGQDLHQDVNSRARGSNPARCHEPGMCMGKVQEWLEQIEAKLLILCERQQIRDWYSVEEFARIVKRSEFTCREWCRRGRIHAKKKSSGRGAHAAWAISHEELERYRRDGLLPTRGNTVIVGA